jgi:hypothetical protein
MVGLSDEHKAVVGMLVGTLWEPVKYEPTLDEIHGIAPLVGVRQELPE